MITLYYDVLQFLRTAQKDIYAIFLKLLCLIHAYISVLDYCGRQHLPSITLNGDNKITETFPPNTFSQSIGVFHASEQIFFLEDQP